MFYHSCDEWLATGERLSDHPAIRYCCGYVEHLCELFNDPALESLAEKLIAHICNSPYFSLHDAVTEQEIKILDSIHLHYFVTSRYLQSAGFENIPSKLRLLRKINPKIWLYSLVRHILEYDRLPWKDRLYVSYWMSRLSTTQLGAIYFETKFNPFNNPHRNRYDLFKRDILDKYPSIKMNSSIDCYSYPAHREEYLCNDADSLGLGCYVQACEKRLISSMDRFIENVYAPLLNSDVDSILICIDPLEEGSSTKRLLKMKSDLLDFEKKTIPNSKTFVLIPREHVNATMGRNIMFSFIRTHLQETLLHWMGADDDDKVLKDGVNQLRTYIIENKITLSKILLYDEHFKNLKRSSLQPYFKRYAPWTYAFSPEYYNGLSYRCVPMEKEDLDFFNRLMQYSKNTIVISKSVYEYNDPNNKRPKNKELFETGDVIDYMNIHNAIESKNDSVNIAPSSSPQASPPAKYYYMNADESYHYHEKGPENIIYPKEKKKKNEKEKKKEKETIPMRTTHYGISIITNDKTKHDIFSEDNVSSVRRSLKSLISRPSSENYNGDLYIVPYIAYSATTSLFAVAFQNGKHPRLEVIRIVPKSVSEVSGSYNELSVMEEINHAAPGLWEIFEPSDTAFSEEDFELISQWNEYYLKTYRTEEHIIPLRTFGGKRVFLSRKCLFMAVLLLMAVCLFILSLLLWQ